MKFQNILADSQVLCTCTKLYWMQLDSYSNLMGLQECVRNDCGRGECFFECDVYKHPHHVLVEDFLIMVFRHFDSPWNILVKTGGNYI